MKKLTQLKLLPLLLFAALFFCNAANAQQNGQARTITVSGIGVCSVPANEASISIGIETNHKDARAAERQNAQIAKAIQDNLLRLGLKKDAITTNNYSIYPVYDNQAGKTTGITGYTVNNSITATITDLTKISGIIDKSIHLGANKVNAIRFSAKSTDELNKKALQLAVKNAEAKAQAIAASLNKKIVNVTSIAEHSASISQQRFSNYELKEAAQAHVETPIQAGSIDITATVEAVFEIE